MKVFKPLTKAEEQIMHVLWESGEATARDIVEKLKPAPHYNTVSTVLKILGEKGFISIRSVGKVNLYKAAIAKNAYSKKSMQQYVQGYFGGSFASMLSFFAQEKDISVQDLEEILKEIKK